MSRHYHAMQDSERFLRHFGAAPRYCSDQADVWPGYSGQFIRCSPKHKESHDQIEALSGMFGLIPDWSTECAISLETFNARSETVAYKNTFKSAWENGQHCIIPAEALFFMVSRGGKLVPSRIALSDGSPMGLAGLWACQETTSGPFYSYTILTVSACDHPLLRQFGQSNEAKCMAVILPKERYKDWLEAPPESSQSFMQTYPVLD